MAQQTVAVIGAGSSGLSMLKNLREDGFKVTCYERRSQVGGLWAYTDDKKMTTALPTTTANISKYTCGMSDFPMPDKYPHYLSQWDFQEYMESYAVHFDMLKDIVFNAQVKQVSRNKDDSKWQIDLVVDGEPRVEEFDKVAFCHGYQTKPRVPEYDGVEKFEGTIMHTQQFRMSDDFKGKKIVVVGISATASDVIAALLPVASKIYMSHRRGALIVPKFRKGYPPDLMSSWRRRQITLWLQRTFPNLTRWLLDRLIGIMIKRMYGDLDPAWGLLPAPSITLSPRAVCDHIIPSLRDGSLTSLPGIKRFIGPRSIEFTNGTVLDDIDYVVCATGYKADFDAAPFLDKSRPSNYGGQDFVRLWMNLFPPKYADSMVLLCYSAFGKNNGFSFSDVTSMAVSNLWRGVEPFPSLEEMEKQIDRHQEWVASRWRLDHDMDISAVKIWEYQPFLHKAAGTGMENLGWGWKGWKFWFRDPKMSYLINNGVETAHAFRYFETGKRRAWPGARDAILHMNELVKQFPIKEEKKIE
ncbi:putative dimethylaniline monooxygenase [Mollisia scopiformis]|uniref:Putative dimethylaniline monooxygenase n=1 Tax=Mollisia scopiformis TaxID=149040 RepID=A0A194X062_MOLSC|nr:putative dimethylaniline monooxygenase [Mollisia scopiformis]KUJ13257.1 putative dimethylaniline monooxygenase [Mollisia scopiformis]